MTGLLVVAGEASGDRAAAGVVDHLHKCGPVRVFGLGGAALRAGGVDLVADLHASTAMGVGETMARGWSIVRAWRAVEEAVHKRRPEAAILVNYSEFNARLAPRLRRDGVRVLWYMPPQIWAWRPSRGETLRRGVDRMAVALPFEEPLWRSLGVDASYVGHPSLEIAPLTRPEARRQLRLTPYAESVAILPGSRPHEVRRLLRPMLGAFALVRADRASVDARVLVAPSLDETTRAWLVATCAKHRVEIHDVDPLTGAAALLRAFDVSLCASGTASLECVLAGAVPVVAYRVGLATALAARALLRTRQVALPNILLGRLTFPELLQQDVRAPAVADALSGVLDRRSEYLKACDDVRSALGTARHPSSAVAQMLAPWLEALGRTG